LKGLLNSLLSHWQAKKKVSDDVLLLFETKNANYMLPIFTLDTALLLVLAFLKAHAGGGADDLLVPSLMAGAASINSLGHLVDFTLHSTY
jgi:hypothetical protein